MCGILPVSFVSGLVLIYIAAPCVLVSLCPLGLRCLIVDNDSLQAEIYLCASVWGVVREAVVDRTAYPSR